MKPFEGILCDRNTEIIFSSNKKKQQDKETEDYGVAHAEHDHGFHLYVQST